MDCASDHRKPLTVWLKSQKDGRLKPIGVLIFIHQDMIEPLSNIGANGWLRHHLRHVLALLCLHVRCKEPAELSFPGHTPWKGRAQHILQRALGIHDTRID
jgi:hypothetical protein